MSSGNQIENEVKIRLSGADDGRARLDAAGFVVRRPRVFEVNILYDSEVRSLRAADSILRLRSAGTECSLTFKGPAERSRHKTRQELETTVADCTTADAILGKLGYAPVFRYEKFRTEFALEGEEGIVTLDETPAGTFFELEGPMDWVDTTAKLLGFSDLEYITASYGSIYLDRCASLGVPAGDMVFAAKVLP